MGIDWGGMEEVDKARILRWCAHDAGQQGFLFGDEGGTVPGSGECCIEEVLCQECGRGLRRQNGENVLEFGSLGFMDCYGESRDEAVSEPIQGEVVEGAMIGFGFGGREGDHALFCGVVLNDDACFSVEVTDGVVVLRQHDDDAWAQDGFLRWCQVRDEVAVETLCAEDAVVGGGKDFESFDTVEGFFEGCLFILRRGHGVGSPVCLHFQGVDPVIQDGFGVCGLPIAGESACAQVCAAIAGEERGRVLDGGGAACDDIVLDGIDAWEFCVVGCG